MPEFDKMLTKQQALELLFSRWCPQLAIEAVAVAESAGRVAAEDVYSCVNIPVVRASAMDGVAINYDIIENGMPDTAKWQLGREYVRADTGDDFADAYDTVIAIENVTLLSDGGLIFTSPDKIKRGINVRPCGSNVKQGDLLVARGTVITALGMAAIAVSGYTSINVLAKPRVGFIPTGSELIPLGAPIERGRVYEANSIMVSQLVRDMGADIVLHDIVYDNREALSQAFDEMLPKCDVLIVNAGTSKGGEDFGTALLAQKGELLLHGVRAVPGRPMGIAVAAGKPVINMSGPTAAAFYSVDWAIRAIVCHALGVAVPKRKTVRATLTAPLNCPPMFSMMCRLELEQTADGIAATPLSGHGPGAARLPKMLTAAGIYITTPGEPPLPIGAEIEVELIR